MLLEFYEAMVKFLEGNAALIVLLMAVVEPIKLFLKKYSWYESYMATLLAFVLGFAFALPADFASFVIVDYLAHGVGLGLVATGIYKVGEGLVRKVLE